MLDPDSGGSSGSLLATIDADSDVHLASETRDSSSAVRVDGWDENEDAIAFRPKNQQLSVFDSGVGVSSGQEDDGQEANVAEQSGMTVGGAICTENAAADVEMRSDITKDAQGDIGTVELGREIEGSSENEDVPSNSNGVDGQLTNSVVFVGKEKGAELASLDVSPKEIMKRPLKATMRPPSPSSPSSDVPPHKQTLSTKGIQASSRLSKTNEDKLLLDHKPDGTKLEQAAAALASNGGVHPVFMTAAKHAPSSIGRSNPSEVAERKGGRQDRPRKKKKAKSTSFTPSFTGVINTREDVEQIFDAARQNVCKIITERIDATGGSMVGKGFIFNAKGSLQRWTEGLTWTRSRPSRHGFQLYNEAEDRLLGNKMKRVKKEGGLVKYTATDRHPGSTLHCVWYTRETQPMTLGSSSYGKRMAVGKDTNEVDTRKVKGVQFGGGSGCGENSALESIEYGNSVGIGGHRRYNQPLFSQMSTYVSDSNESPAQEEIHEFNKAANVAWKSYQRNLRRTGTGRGGTSEYSSGAKYGSVRHQLGNGGGFNQGLQGVTGGDCDGGSKSGNGGYGGPSELEMLREHQRQLRMCQQAQASNMGSMADAAFEAMGGSGMNGRARSDSAMERNMREQMRQSNMMSRLSNRYRGFDEIESMYRTMDPRISYLNYEAAQRVREQHRQRVTGGGGISGNLDNGVHESYGEFGHFMGIDGMDISKDISHGIGSVPDYNMGIFGGGSGGQGGMQQSQRGGHYNNMQ